MSPSPSMQVLLGAGGPALVPVAHDWDARFGVVNDGTGKASSWTDQEAGLAATQSNSARRPTINTTLLAGIACMQNTSSSIVGMTAAGLPDLYSHRDPLSITMRLRPSMITGMHPWGLGVSGSSTWRQEAAFGRLVAGTWAYSRISSSQLHLDDGAHGLVVNTWYTIGWTWDDGTVSFYKNGVLSSTGSCDLTIANALTQITIGTYNSYSSAFRGYYGRFRLYAGAISAAQHAQDHAAFAAVWA